MLVTHVLKSEFILLITVSNFFSLALCPLDYNHLPAFLETTFYNRPRELQNNMVSVNVKSIFLFKGQVVLALSHLCIRLCPLESGFKRNRRMLDGCLPSHDLKLALNSHLGEILAYPYETLKTALDYVVV